MSCNIVFPFRFRLLGTVGDALPPDTSVRNYVYYTKNIATANVIIPMSSKTIFPLPSAKIHVTMPMFYAK